MQHGLAVNGQNSAPSRCGRVQVWWVFFLFFASFASVMIHRALRPLRLKERVNRKGRKEDSVITKKRLPTKVGHTQVDAVMSFTINRTCATLLPVAFT